MARNCENETFGKKIHFSCENLDRQTHPHDDILCCKSVILLNSEANDWAQVRGIHLESQHFVDRGVDGKLDGSKLRGSYDFGFFHIFSEKALTHLCAILRMYTLHKLSA